MDRDLFVEGRTRDVPALAPPSELRERQGRIRVGGKVGEKAATFGKGKPFHAPHEWRALDGYDGTIACDPRDADGPEFLPTIARPERNDVLRTIVGDGN